jgi:hypothetical protein
MRSKSDVRIQGECPTSYSQSETRFTGIREPKFETADLAFECALSSSDGVDRLPRDDSCKKCVSLD